MPALKMNYFWDQYYTVVARLPEGEPRKNAFYEFLNASQSKVVALNDEKDLQKFLEKSEELTPIITAAINNNAFTDIDKTNLKNMLTEIENMAATMLGPQAGPTVKMHLPPQSPEAYMDEKKEQKSSHLLRELTHGNNREVMSILSEIDKSEVDEPSTHVRYGYTALILSAAKGPTDCGNGKNKISQREIIGTLLNLGANVKAVDNQGRTPLHYLCLHGDVDLIADLVEKGASYDCKDKDGLTPLDFLFFSREVAQEILRNAIEKPADYTQGEAFATVEAFTMIPEYEFERDKKRLLSALIPQAYEGLFDIILKKRKQNSALISALSPLESHIGYLAREAQMGRSEYMLKVHQQPKTLFEPKFNLDLVNLYLQLRAIASSMDTEQLGVDAFRTKEQVITGMSVEYKEKSDEIAKKIKEMSAREGFSPMLERIFCEIIENLTTCMAARNAELQQTLPPRAPGL